MAIETQQKSGVQALTEDDGSRFWCADWFTMVLAPASQVHECAATMQLGSEAWMPPQQPGFWGLGMHRAEGGSRQSWSQGSTAAFLKREEYAAASLSLGCLVYGDGCWAG